LCQQALEAAGGELGAEALLRLPRLQISTRPRLWRQWFDAQGIESPQAMAGMRMELFSMVAQAAAQGLGVGLIPRFLVERELASGSLVQLLPIELPSDRSYWFIVPQRKADQPLVSGFREWLVAQARPETGAQEG
jgi:LysR family glycine cleavage system transcriptional activator